MKERPIIISTQLIPPTLDGRKTMTRRPITRLLHFGDITEFQKSTTPGYDWMFCDKRMLWNDISSMRLMECCPYGQPGDRLWVRETFVIENDYEYIDGLRLPPIDRPIKIMKDPEGCEYHLIPHYRATEPEPNIVPYDLNDPTDDKTRWASPRFMPRWASRISLEIVSVSVERLQGITEEDAAKEGFKFTSDKWNWVSAAYDFHKYWNSLYTKKPELQWEANPWVWVVEFKKCPTNAE